MRARHVVVAVAAACAAACSKPASKAALAQRPNFLFDVPYLPQSILEDTTGTPETQHVVLLAPAPIDSVVRFYRHRLPPMGWRPVSDVGDSLHVSLYRVRGELPMWIQMEAQGPQTRVSFTAAGPGPGDTGGAPRGAPR